MSTVIGFVAVRTAPTEEQLGKYLNVLKFSRIYLFLSMTSWVVKDRRGRALILVWKKFWTTSE
jgi:hypothetical protein